MSSTPPGTPGPASTGPIPPPRNPLQQRSPHADLLAELKEKVHVQLERAMADDAAAKERQLQSLQGARGEALEGGVEVRVDAKGMLAQARFGPEIVGMTSEELRGLTFEALQDAQSQLGLAHPSSMTSDPRHREVAAAIMDLIGRTPRP